MPSKDETYRWHFVLQADQCWSWKRLGDDGSVDETSETCADFGKAVAHALRHGFNPRRHLWIVDHHQWHEWNVPGKSPALFQPAPSLTDMGSLTRTLLPQVPRESAVKHR